MASETQPLHIMFLPMMAAGHMIPMVDMARLFAARGVKATIVTTPANAPSVQSTIDRDRHPIHVHLIPFPSAAVGLPNGCENVSGVTSPETKAKFRAAIEMLRHPFGQAVGDLRPDCVVADICFWWSVDVAAEHSIPRLVFHGTGFFALSATKDFINLRESPPTSDSETVVLPGLPHRIEMRRSQIPDVTSIPRMAEVLERMKESDERSYGVVVNSFYELEPDYVRHYREVVGRRAWHLGPVSLCNGDETHMSRRGSEEAILGREVCLEWLDGKEPGSVLYVCFGSQSDFTAAQVNELAVGLEASGFPFIWVMRKEMLPEGYEEMVEGRGMVVKGWAPQISILSHRAAGGFLTHCGWNSSLEGIAAGLPMITWPLAGEQFYNERLLVDVLGVGVAVGIEKFAMEPKNRTVVGSAAIEKAIEMLMRGGEAAERRRQRARELADMAKAAVSDGGSSFVDMGNLIKELTRMRNLATKTGA